MINWRRLLLKFIKELLPKVGKSLQGVLNKVANNILYLLKRILKKVVPCKKGKNGHIKDPIVHSNKDTTLSDFVSFNAKRGFLTGIDIHDTNININWKDVKAAGIAFAYIKATEGAVYTAHNNHTIFMEQWAEAGANAILRGAYFYYLTDHDMDTPENQAKNFIDRVLTVSKPTDLPPAIDIEQIDFNKITVEQLQSDILTWLKLVENAIGKRPIIYSDRDYHKHILNTAPLKDYKVWIADPDSKLEPQVSKWTFWQNKMDIVVPSITGKIDLNRFEGSLEELKQL